MAMPNGGIVLGQAEAAIGQMFTTVYLQAIPVVAAAHYQRARDASFGEPETPNPAAIAAEAKAIATAALEAMGVRIEVKK